MASETPLLTLETLTAPPAIDIDGIRYPLRMPDALSIVGYRKLAHSLQRLETLWALDAPTPKEDAELTRLFRRVAAVVIEAPDEVLAGLTDLQCVLVYQTFLTLPHSTLLRVGAMFQGGMPASLRPSTGASSVPASAGSTGARRTPGSTRSRKGSFARAS